MTSKIVSDELRAIVEPFLPVPKVGACGGRPPLSNRAALIGIVFVLRSGIPRRMLPQGMVCSSVDDNYGIGSTLAYGSAYIKHSLAIA